MPASYDTDVLVIGGGSTGLGIARDLAKRGLGVVLAEQGDLREGTSGRYHGLLHSGGRYAVNDPETARECIAENAILRRTMPHAIEDTGGLFVTTPADPPDYADTWLAACRAAGIPAEEIPASAALRREPALNRGISRAFTVPDAACDSFDALASVALAAEADGATIFTYHSVVALRKVGDCVTGAHLRDNKTGDERAVTARMVVNATGPWAGQIAALAGIELKMKNSRGALVALNLRWVNTVINRCRPPGDGDIMVPVGTVCVLGTTSVPTDDPFDARVEPWEVSRILEEANPMAPGLERTRALRAWAGVRPIYDPGSGAEGRAAKRTFEVLDHEARDGFMGFISVVGGKFTTYRFMAEKAADLICAKLGVNVPCTTADEVLPPPPNMEAKPHYLGARLDKLEHGATPGELICECELVTRPQIERALADYDHPPALNDLRRDLRIGMGPCQGGFCAFRTAAIRHEVCGTPATETVEALREFAQRRFGGVYPLLWGHNLRQAMLDEMIARRVMGRVVREGDRAVQAFGKPEASGPLPTLPDGRGKTIVVVGAGLAGLTAALTAARSGAQVHVIAAGVGKTHVSPGWMEVLDTYDNLDAALAQFVAAHPAHPYALAGLDSLRAGMGLVCEAATAHGIPFCTGQGANALVTMLTGLTRRAATVPQSMAATSPEHGTALIVGFTGWRDFYPTVTADNLCAQGFAARALAITLPQPPADRFDYWPVDLARLFERPDFRADVIRQVRPHLGGVARVGFPAVLGLYAALQVQQDLEAAFGVPVFEIGTLPPSVPGMRLYHALRAALLAAGARFTVGPRVTRGVVGDPTDRKSGRVTGVVIETAAVRARILRADAVILATGGLFGGGIESNHKGELWETIFDLPVEGPRDRTRWFLPALFPPPDQQHPIHQAGVRADAHMRPVEGAPAGLYVCGRLLAGYDPLREGTSEGVDLATGYRAAVEAVSQ